MTVQLLRQAIAALSASFATTGRASFADSFEPGSGQWRVLEWLMWQMGGPGPMFGQVHHFVKYNRAKTPYAEERYLEEAHRLYSVLAP